MIGGDHYFKPSRFNHCPEKHRAHTGDEMPLECGITGIFIGYSPWQRGRRLRDGRGAGPALTGVVGGQAQVYFSPLSATIGYIRAGTLRVLAVTTASRSDALPDIPAMGEIVSGYEASQWYGVGVPKNTPVAIVEKLNKEINAGLANPKLKAQLADLGGTVLPGSAADFGKLIAEETEKWAKVVKFSGAKPD